MEPASPEAAVEFAATLSDHPFTLGARSLIHRRIGRVWLRGPPSRTRAAVVSAPWLPSEPMAFGPDPAEIWSLLGEIPGWDCVNVESAVAPSLSELLSRELGVPTRVRADVHYVLDGPVREHAHPAVRRLGENDVGLFERAPPAMRIEGFVSTVAALTGGVVAGAVVGEELVSRVALELSTETYADLNAHTLAAWRNRGLGSAAASLVAAELRNRDLTPVWSAGEENLASRRIAEKVGFREFGRKSYVVVPTLQASGGYRTDSA
jgi:L-amino acid N-acyltransferase YncA